MEEVDRIQLAEAAVSIAETVPGRESQTHFLLSYLYGSHTNPLFISGPPSTGKTFLLTRILPLFPNVPTAHLDCVELCTDRLLFKKAVQVLHSQQHDKKSNEAMAISPTGGIPSLVTALASLPKPSILILDRAERLTSSRYSPTLPEVLLRLGELTGTLKVIFISSLPFHIFSRDHHHLDTDEPYQLHFPDYTSEDLFKILTLQYIPNKINKHDTKLRYQSFLKLILETCLPITTNVKELKRIACKLYKFYLFPLSKNPKLNNVQLYHHIEPHLIHSSKMLYNHHYHYSLKDNEIEMRKQNQQYLSSSSMELSERQQLQEEENKNDKNIVRSLSIGLPIISRRLLIAAFLSSYNPPSQDVRHFTKNRVRKRNHHRRRRYIKRKRNPTDDNGNGDEGEDDDNGDDENEKGGKIRTFPLERLFAIYRAIGDGENEDVVVTTGVMIALGNLIKMGFLEKDGTNLVGFDGRYRCGKMFRIEEAKLVAKSIHVVLEEFLHQG